jgi:glycosyltransferase involved in cell wall biosynthesis
MPTTRQPQRVISIIPARNEETTIGEVVLCCLTSRTVDEVVVAVNGSRDKTAEIAASIGAQILHREKSGKGEAMRDAVTRVAGPGDIVLFLDGDLRGLTSDQVDGLVAPIVQGRYDMTCGILRGRLWRRAVHDNIFLRHLPTLTGQRALRASVFLEIDEADMHGYNVEAALNRHIRTAGLSARRLPLEGVIHRKKEEKGSAVKGKLEKYVMIGSVYLTYARLVSKQFLSTLRA